MTKKEIKEVAYFLLNAVDASAWELALQLSDKIREASRKKGDENLQRRLEKDRKKRLAEDLNNF